MSHPQDRSPAGKGPAYDQGLQLRAALADGIVSEAERELLGKLQRQYRLSDDTVNSMVEEIKQQLAEREANASGQPNHTDVVMLDAKLLGIEELNEFYMASVEFSGLIREEPSAGPTPFREVWNMTRPKEGPAGWLVAGVQALQ